MNITRYLLGAVVLLVLSGTGAAQEVPAPNIIGTSIQSDAVNLADFEGDKKRPRRVLPDAHVTVLPCAAR